MKVELTKQFVKKTARRTLIFAFVMIIVSAIAQAISPVITNEMALTQMQNDNVMFVAMNTYYKLKPVVNIAYSCAILWFVCTIGRDTYKFAKSFNTIENEKEKN